MRKNIYTNKLLLALSIPVLMLSCSEDDKGGASVTFTSIETTVLEANAPENIVIPFKEGTLSVDDITFRGSATMDEDYEVVGITAEGIELRILDDDLLEDFETILIQIPGAKNGNSFHTVRIQSKCEDMVGLTLDHFDGAFHATEVYGPGSSYGPYAMTLYRDTAQTKRDHFNIIDFWDSNLKAYMVVDLEAGTVTFPAQNSSSGHAIVMNTPGTFSFCESETEGHLQFTINVSYRGDTFDYVFKKDTRWK